MLERIDFKAEKLTKEEYKPVHGELVDKLVLLQQQARSKGVGLVVLVEGWSGAGKGSRISELVYELDARATKVHVTEDINPKEARKFPGAKWGVTGDYPLMKQFWQSLGERGEITFYDRGWYTAAAEQVLFGLTGADPKAVKRLAKKAKNLHESEIGAMEARLKLRGDVISGYQQMAHNFEQMLVDDGYAVVKLFVHVSKKAQRKRLEALRDNPDTAWRVSKRKLELTKYYDEAYKLFQFLVLFDHLNAKYWMGLGAVQQVLKDYQSAVVSYGYCSFLNLENPKPQLHAAECFLALGDKVNAASSLEALNEYCPTDTDIGREYRAKAAKLRELVGEEAFAELAKKDEKKQ